MTQLNYLEVVDRDGRVALANGVVQSDQVDTLARERALRGRGLRLYLAEGAAPGIGGSLWQLLEAAPRALSELWAVLMPAAGAAGPRLEGRLTPDALRQRYCSLDLERHRFEIFDLAAARDLDELVASWTRLGATRGHLLFELDATRAAIETLMRDTAGAERGAALAGLPAPARAPALPAETAASAARRAELARDWLDADGVSTLLGSRAENTSQLPNRLRREGRVLGVWLVGENRYRFPAWQFTPAGQVIPAMREVLAILRGPRGVAGGRPTSGWEEIEWLWGPHALLDDRRPAEALATEPERVLAVARQEFGEDPDARW